MADNSGLIKLALIAGGGYFLYQSGAFNSLLPASAAGGAGASGSTGSGGSNTGGGNSTIVPGSTPLPNKPAPTGGGGSTSTGQNSGSVAVMTREQIDAVTIQAAGGDVVAAAQANQLGLRYNGHQWNWFREKAGKGVSPDGTDAVMTATEYLAWRQSKGWDGATSLGAIPIYAFRPGGWM